MEVVQEVLLPVRHPLPSWRTPTRPPESPPCCSPSLRQSTPSPHPTLQQGCPPVKLCWGDPILGLQSLFFQMTKKPVSQQPVAVEHEGGGLQIHCLAPLFSSSAQAQTRQQMVIKSCAIVVFNVLSSSQQSPQLDTITLSPLKMWLITHTIVGET